MILVTGTSRLVDGAREEMVAAVEAMVAATLAEDGCLECRYSFDVSDPDLMSFHEVYESEVALAAHMQSEHMAAFYGVAQRLMGGRPDVTKWVGAKRATMG